MKAVIVGGGAAGMFAAALLSRSGIQVTLLEHNEKLGKKLFITGKGRCNLTNDCTPEEFRANVVSNSKFLFSASDALPSREVIRLFEKWGLATKVERGRRVFPVSDHSSDVIAALEREIRGGGVKVLLNAHVTEILRERIGLAEVFPDQMGASAAKLPAEKTEAAGRTSLNGSPDGAGTVGEESQSSRKSKSKKEKGKGNESRILGVRYQIGGREETLLADTVILATGGLSYPSTGSTGDGYTFARKLDLSVTELHPSLVPINCREEYVKELQGLSLKNVSLTIRSGKKELFSDFGELLFTHFGISGPLTLSASAVLGPVIGKKELTTRIDLKPAVDYEQLDARFVRVFEANPRKALKNVLHEFYPAKLTQVIPVVSEVDEEKQCSGILRAERERLVECTKAFPLTLTSLRGYQEAVITKGGIAVKEIDPRTMEAKRCKGLYCIGEVLDVDAFTGGYNLQIAWCTAAACAAAIAGGR